MRKLARHAHNVVLSTRHLASMALAKTEMSNVLGIIGDVSVYTMDGRAVELVRELAENTVYVVTPADEAAHPPSILSRSLSSAAELLSKMPAKMSDLRASRAPHPPRLQPLPPVPPRDLSKSHNGPLIMAPIQEALLVT